MALALPFSPLAEPLGFVRLPVAVLLMLGAITIGYVAVTELAKPRFFGSRAPLVPDPARR